MGNTYGQTTIAALGRSVRVSADGCPEAKAGGITIDWSVIAAVTGADVEFDDGFTVKIGEKYLKRGQVVTLITAGEISTVTLVAGSSGDTFTITVVNAAGVSATSAAIAFDAIAATVQAAVELLANVGAGNVTVTGTNPDFTFAFATALGDVTVTGTGTGMTVTVATTSAGARTGKYGPYDSAAVDGRQTLTKGSTFILDASVKENDLKSDHAGVAIYGGLLWKDRVRAHASSASLANGPTHAALEACLPRIQWCLNS